MSADRPLPNRPIEDLLLEAITAFQDIFLQPPLIATCAPGRVNLIGEHTDYNCGLVFPMALDLVTILVGRKSHDRERCRLKTLALKSDEREIVEFEIPSKKVDLKPSMPSWANYIKGVISNFHADVEGFDAIIVSSIPLGAGLSSSAALEVATYTFLETLLNSKANSLQNKALACQKAEHEFANVPCGIMDQFISTMGVKGHALLIDCRSMNSSLIPLNDSSVTFVIINSNVKHELSGSEYPARKNDCHSAAKIMKKESLRDATLQDLENFKDNLSETMVKRVRHVISEINRTLRATDALQAGDYSLFGKLMKESHDSLKVDFEVSCKEIDELVNLAISVPGVFGSRITGGGFGGCTVTLVRKENVPDLINHVKKNYSGNATFYECDPSSGARVLMNHGKVISSEL